MKKTKYLNGWYDLMDGNTRINRQWWSAGDARESNKQRELNNISSRWVYGKQPGRPKKKK